ncbi:MAG TPA: M20/M25/M40 family metallo-hydrolase [Terriglobales bacterium]|jgi:acetylornithine deacetylase/succinyl-diaminopimelate desuccinylase-like protein|nr:M20/M25/M40 family metallo-hydrolase [Terriglobales bacterium]
MAPGSRPETAEVAPSIQEVARLSALPQVQSAFRWFLSQEPQIAEWQMQLAGIAAPPFGEGERAAWLAERFRELDLNDVHLDEVGNVFGIRRGLEPSNRFLAITAHIDTVFPAGTALRPRREGSRLYGPGISDNGAGVAALLATAGALQASSIRHLGPLVFVGNVGEEGEGDLRGMRHIFSDPHWSEAIAATLVLDGAGADSVVAEALGSRRFEVVVRGPGGHSWSDFGAPNPIIVLARAIERFTQVRVAAVPKTTFNIGVIRGGTSVNSIPELASMRVDLRSTSSAEIDRLELALRAALDQALMADAGKARSGALTYEATMIGSRPAGELDSNARILRVIRAVDSHLGNPSQVQRASTDANIPLSLGREAVAIGGGGAGGGAHTVQEWFDCAGREVALKRILLAALALAGVAA